MASAARKAGSIWPSCRPICCGRSSSRLHAGAALHCVAGAMPTTAMACAAVATWLTARAAVSAAAAALQLDVPRGRGRDDAVATLAPAVAAAASARGLRLFILNLDMLLSISVRRRPTRSASISRRCGRSRSSPSSISRSARWRCRDLPLSMRGANGRRSVRVPDEMQKWCFLPSALGAAVLLAARQAAAVAVRAGIHRGLSASCSSLPSDLLVAGLRRSGAEFARGLPDIRTRAAIISCATRSRSLADLTSCSFPALRDHGRRDRHGGGLRLRGRRQSPRRHAAYFPAGAGRGRDIHGQAAEMNQPDESVPSALASARARLTRARRDGVTTLADSSMPVAAWPTATPQSGRLPSRQLAQPVLGISAAQQRTDLTVWRGGTLCGFFALRPRVAAVLDGPGPSTHSSSRACRSSTGTRRQDAIDSLPRRMRGMRRSFSNRAGRWPILGHARSCVPKAGAPITVLDRWERAALATEGTFRSGSTAISSARGARNIAGYGRGSAKRESSKASPGARASRSTLARRSRRARGQGWKGRRGTALRPIRRWRLPCARRCTRSRPRAALRFWKLALDGRPIAMMFGASCQATQGWLGKIAYERPSPNISPGVLLILDATESLIDEERAHSVDSCAIPDHPMINNIWRDRIALCDVMIGPPGMSPRLSAMIVAAETGRRRRAQGRQEARITAS